MKTKETSMHRITLESFMLIRLLSVAVLLCSVGCGGDDAGQDDSAGAPASGSGTGSSPPSADDSSLRLDMGPGSDLSSSGSPCDAVVLTEWRPTNARFVPGQPVQLVGNAFANQAEACTTELRLQAIDVGRVIHEETLVVSLQPGSATEVMFTWDAPDDDFRGYVVAVSSEAAPIVVTTGVDVSSTPVRYPRYGYFSVFPPGQSASTTAEQVRVLTQRFHLNMFQLYDWFWRHENLIPRNEDGSIPASWVDLFDRENSWATIMDLVGAIHEHQAWAMAYVTIYAAREGFEQISGVPPGCGLFETPAAESQVSLAFGGERFLFLFDPSNPGWQERMANEYVGAIEAGNFDGVHIDQFGARPTLFRADGSPVELNQTFAPFLETIDAALETRVPERDACVFNIVEGRVDGYAVEEVATTSACDFLYSEIWFTNNTYEELRAYIEQLRAIGGGRAVVLAVYAQYGENVGRIFQAEDAQLQGVEVASDHVEFTGTGFVDAFDMPGDSITWTFDMEERGFVSFVFRYANATEQAATRTLVLDGDVVGTVRFLPNSSWDEWFFDAWLQTIVEPGQHQVSLVYTDSDVGAINVDRLTLGEFNEPAVQLQNAVIFASGATPIQIGDEVQSLAHEFFPNRSLTLTPSSQRALERQYSFITAHERLLFSPEVVPIPERLERVERVSEGAPLIAEGVGGIWTLVRSTPVGDAIHLVNLVGVDNDLWRDTAPVPERQENVTLRYRVEDPESIQEVLWASPDDSALAFEPLDFITGDGYVELTVPSLAYWDVVLVR